MSSSLPSSSSTSSVPNSSSSYAPVLENCAYSIIRGSLLGAVVGGSFHIVGGGYLQSKGRNTLNKTVILKEASRASLRLSSVIGGYTAVRCGLLSITRSDAISCGIAGACAVAIPTLMDPYRIQFLQTYYTNSLKTATSTTTGKPLPPLPKHFVIATSAFSGAVIFGGLDMLLHRLLGLRW